MSFPILSDLLQRKGTINGRVLQFSVPRDEVNPVIRELESHGIAVTAAHSHMLRESPPRVVADGIKAALARVNVAR